MSERWFVEIKPGEASRRQFPRPDSLKTYLCAKKEIVSHSSCNKNALNSLTEQSDHVVFPAPLTADIKQQPLLHWF